MTENQYSEIWQSNFGQELRPKIFYSASDLEEILKVSKNQGKSIVWTNGSFDVMHIGHMFFLQQAKKYGDILVVGVNSDASIKKYKPVKAGIERPIFNQDMRTASVLSVKGVDYAIIFDEPSPIGIIETIKPNVWVRANNYQTDYNMKMENHPEGQAILKNGGKCVMVDTIGDYSTSRILKSLKNTL